MPSSKSRIVFAAIQELRALCTDIQDLIEQRAAAGQDWRDNRALGVALRRLLRSFKCLSHGDHRINGWLLDQDRMIEAEAILREFGPETLGEALAKRARDARMQFKKNAPGRCIVFRPVARKKRAAAGGQVEQSQ